MTKHSTVVGGSSCSIVLKCNASIELSQSMPPEPANPYALMGTALHACMEDLILNDRLPDYYLDRVMGHGRETWKISQPMIRNKLKPAHDWFRTYFCPSLKEVKHLFVERRVHFKGAIEGAFGTADIVFQKKNEAGIIDWKFGDGVLVPAADNNQMRFYLAGAIYAGYLPVQDVYSAYIYQPSERLSPNEYVSRAEYTIEELDGFIEALKAQVEGERKYQVGEHCKWCKAKIKCPALLAAIKGTTETDIEGITNKMLSQYLAMVPAIAAWCEDVKDHAKRIAQKGIMIPGWELVGSRGHRYYKDEAAASRALQRLGLTREERAKIVLISPAQAEKELLARGVPVQEIEKFTKRHCDRPDAGERLVKCDESKGNAISRMAKSLEAYLARGTHKKTGKF